MAITTNWQYDLNGFTMGQGATLPTTGSTISITEISGFDHPDVNATISTRSNQAGSFVTAKYRKERVIVLTGRLNTSAANYAADTYTLKKIFQAQDPPIAFTFRMPGFGNQYVNVSPQGVRYAVSNVATAVGWVDFMATMTAGDPRIYTSAQSSQSIAVAGTQTCTNNGTENAPTNIVFIGPLTNPVVTDTTTGAAFGLTLVIPSGQSVSANSLNATVLNGSTSQYSTISATNKTWIELVSGANSLSLAASAGTGTVTMQWNDTYF